MSRMRIKRLGLHPVANTVVCVLIGSIGSMAFAAPTAVSAQQQTSRLVLRSCNLASYPTVTCGVALIEPSGVTLTGVPAAAFEVSDGGNTIPISSVVESPSPDATTSTMLVLDLSGSPLPGSRYVNDLKVATKASLEGKPFDQELVGLIAMTGRIENPSSADNIPLDEGRELGFSKDTGALINKIQPLNARAGTPLQDGLVKALLLLRRQPFGTRAVVVMTDGFDRNSTTSNVEEVITLAQREGIPIFSFGFGRVLDENKLKRLAVATGGAYTAAGDAGAVAAAYRAIQDRLKMQYALTFTIPGDEKVERKLTFRVNLPDRAVDQAETTIKPQAPTLPKVEAVKFLIGDEDKDPNALPASDVVVEPVIYAQAVSRVEYRVDDGENVVTYQQPFTYTVRGAGFAPGSSHTLLIRVYGAEGRSDLLTEQTLNFTIVGATATSVIGTTEGTAEPLATVEAPVTPVVEATAEPSGIDGVIQRFRDNPLLGGALLVGVLALLALLAMIIVSASRRRKPSSPMTDMITNPFGSVTSYPSTEGPPSGFDTASPMFGRTNDDPTQVFVDTSVESAKTQVLQTAKAMLEVTGGLNKGDRIPLGVPGKSVVVIGRDADPLTGDLRLQSSYVSRRHAEIHIDGDDLYLVDLNSASGTKLNGERIKPDEKRKLDMGAEISFADVKAKVSSPD